MVTPNSRFIRAIVIGLCVMMMKRVSVVEVISCSRLQKRSTLWSSRGASTPAGQRAERLRLLAGRLGDDFKSGLQRVLALDQMQRGLAAAEQFGEQPLEM